MKAGLIVGIVITLAGLSVVMSAFHIHFPLLRASIGLLFAWLGLSMVLSSMGVDARWMPFRPHGRSVNPFTANAGKEIGVIFAHNPIDLSGAVPGETIKVNVIFGDAVVRYDPSVPLELRTSTAFGNTSFADGMRLAFGERVIRTPACHGDEAHAVVDITTVFGNTELAPMTGTAPQSPTTAPRAAGTPSVPAL